MKPSFRIRSLLLCLLLCGVMLLASPARAAVKIFEEPGVDTLAARWYYK